LVSKGFSKLFYLVLVFSLNLFLVAGCGSGPASQMPNLAVEVEAMQVMQKDTPITYEYVGQVQPKEEVNLQAKVSGNIVQKMVNGGDIVRKGQPLFQIDRRQYYASLLSAKAQLAQAEATLSNSRLDTMRYKKLAEQGATAQQTLDTQMTTEKQNAAAVAANRAMVKQAQDSLQDTLIVSPINGKIDINDLSVGSFVQAGSTTMATISSIDPVFVQFSMSENQYLQLARRGNGSIAKALGSLKLVLSDGSEYPLTGHVDQVDRGLTQNTGTLTLKATFNNPQKILVPGMFARVISQGETRKGALLVPQRAVQQILDKTFVTVVGKDNKAEVKPVKMGARVGDLWLVEGGLSPNDRVVVEGTTKVQLGMALKVKMIGLADLQSPAKQ